ncbi:hypothetical protein ACF3DV_32935 (plasmid) [Chlorogloeopsis fritschii PCC 9212]|nr:hypothetical protein [Chlorogloeopsis fritschii]
MLPNRTLNRETGSYSSPLAKPSRLKKGCVLLDEIVAFVLMN